MIKLHLFRGETGTPIAADADPNTTEPPDALVVGTPIKNATTLGGPVEALAMVQGGASTTVEVWIHSAQLDQWFLHAAAVACATDETTSLGDIPCDARTFFRVTAGDGERLAILFL